MFKCFALAATGLALLAVPASGQQYVPSVGSGNLVQGPGGPPATPDTPAYVGRGGEAYNYRHAYGAAHCRLLVRHEWRNGHRIKVRRRVCR